MPRPRKNVEEVEIEEQITPVEEQITPVEEQITPVEEEIVPIEGKIVPVEEEIEEKSGDVKVFDSNGNFIRAYSKKEHGKDFKSLAEQFVSKKGYSIR